MVLAELAIAENNSEHFARMATTLFEGSDWPALLAEDAQLREMLASLAILHGLEFAPLSYEDIVRARMIELDTTIVSDEVSTIIHPFTVDETAVIKVVISIEFDIQLSDKIQVSLEDPRGRIISSDQLVEYYPSSEADRVSNITREGSVIVIVLFPDDPLVNPILGDWKLYVTAPIGSNMFIGMIQL